MLDFPTFASITAIHVGKCRPWHLDYVSEHPLELVVSEDLAGPTSPAPRNFNMLEVDVSNLQPIHLPGRSAQRLKHGSWQWGDTKASLVHFLGIGGVIQGELWSNYLDGKRCRWDSSQL
jgi:hypothetical protein